MLRLAAPFLLLALGLSAACDEPPIDVFEARVVGVPDGDSLKVRRGLTEIEVRLQGIDCPERGQPFSKQARKRAGELARGKEVRLEVLDVDRYGRQVARVTLPDGRELNAELLRDGLAWWYRRYAPGNDLYRSLEEDARKAGRGLWREREPMAPWEWRRQRRERSKPRQGAASDP